MLSKGGDIDLKKRFAPSIASSTVLQLAVRKGDANAVRTLLKHKADPNHDHKLYPRYTPLAQAAFVGNDLIIKLLLEAGAKREYSCNERGTLFHALVSWQVKWDLTKQVEVLYNNGFDIEAKDDHGRTPLHRATIDNTAAAVKQLLTLGANPHAKDANGLMPIHWAVLKKHAPLIELLSPYTPIQEDDLSPALAHGIQEVFLKRGFKPPCITEILKAYNLKLSFWDSSSGIQCNTLGDHEVENSLCHWQTLFIADLVLPQKNLLIAGHNDGKYYFYCAVGKVLLLMENFQSPGPYSRKGVSSFEVNSSLILALDRQLSAGSTLLEANERLLFVEDGSRTYPLKPGWRIVGPKKDPTLYSTLEILNKVFGSAFPTAV